MASTFGHRAATVARAAVIAAGVVILVSVVAFRVIGTTRNLDVGETAETRVGHVTVRGWEAGDDGTEVSVHACPSGSGATIDLSALRLGTGDDELEPTGSSLGPSADDGGATGCVEGVVVFPAADEVDRVIYLTSPHVVWRDRAD